MQNQKATALIVEPAEVLTFRDKFGHVGGEALTLKNKSETEVYYKVKTTAHKFYSVRPSAGIIKPHGQMKVMVTPHDDTTGFLDKVEEEKHRFMVQSAIVDQRNTMPADKFWKEVNGQQPVTVVKIGTKVARIQPMNSNNNNGGANGEEEPAQPKQKEELAPPKQEELTPPKQEEPAPPKQETPEKSATHQQQNAVQEQQPVLDSTLNESMPIQQQSMCTNASDGVNDSFGHYVAKLVGSLKPKTATAARKDIAELMAKYEQLDTDGRDS